MKEIQLVDCLLQGTGYRVIDASTGRNCIHTPGGTQWHDAITAVKEIALVLDCLEQVKLEKGETAFALEEHITEAERALASLRYRLLLRKGYKN